MITLIAKVLYQDFGNLHTYNLMFLSKIQFQRHKNKANDWSIEGKNDEWVEFNKDINLIVGKNATGKSKTINIIRQLAELLCGDIKLSELVYDTSSYKAVFTTGNDNYIYELSFENGKVETENLTINNETKLSRQGNKGQVFYEGLKEDVEFEIEEDVVAVARVDYKQQPFLSPLHKWGKTFSLYRFGSSLGKESVMRDINRIDYDRKIDLKDSKAIVEIFIKGKELFKDEFIASVIEDMKVIGYNLKSVEVCPIKRIPGYWLEVQEEDIATQTNQVEMSQGMFRALSLLIQLNFSLQSAVPSCILIDDIGEGLDYDRTTKLINLLIEKIKNSVSTQVFMTTNDRFIMNAVPLDYWSVIQRIGSKSIFYNYKNSKSIFDEFDYTGLNNFEFLSREFYAQNFEK